MKPLDRVLLKHQQIEELQEEKENIAEALAPTNPFRSKISKPNLLHARSRSIDKLLADYAPEKLSGDEKDKLSELEKELRGSWTQGMPTEEEMRKNPAGMVDRHRKWEKAYKPTIMKWKNIRRQLEPDSDDPDIANIERYRPSGVMDRYVSSAQIPGAMNYQSVPEHNWDKAFQGVRPGNTALEQVKRVTKIYTEEEKQVLRQRLELARKIKKEQAEQAAAEAAAPPDGVPQPEPQPELTT